MARRSAYRYAAGPDAPEMLFEAITERASGSMLDLGCGPGELGQRVRTTLGNDVVGVDISPRMVRLATERGVPALVCDAQSLPFKNDLFDLVAAAWVLYHVQDVDKALSEIRRVLRPNGCLIAVTNCPDHLGEARALAGIAATDGGSFSSQDAPEMLRRHFADVEVRDASGTIDFPDRESIASFIHSWQTFRGVLTLPDDITFPFVVQRRTVILVARAPEGCIYSVLPGDQAS